MAIRARVGQGRNVESNRSSIVRDPAARFHRLRLSPSARRFFAPSVPRGCVWPGQRNASTAPHRFTRRRSWAEGRFEGSRGAAQRFLFCRANRDRAPRRKQPGHPPRFFHCSPKELIKATALIVVLYGYLIQSRQWVSPNTFNNSFQLPSRRSPINIRGMTNTVLISISANTREETPGNSSKR